MGARPRTMLAGLKVWEIPVLCGKSLRQVTTMTRHSSTISFGTRLKGRGTQKQRVWSLRERIPRSMRGTCWPAAQNSMGTESLSSSLRNSLSAWTRSMLKPRRLNTVRSFSIPMMMSLGPRLYVIREVFLLRLLMRLKAKIPWNLIRCDLISRYGSPWQYRKSTSILSVG